jgi:cell fate (sporulation/competence/biofilm development) regulator YlbF (YheA/YmcA/DUF963 family)
VKEREKTSTQSAAPSASLPEDVLAAARRHPETDWRRFPQFEQTFASSDAMKEVMAKIEKTCRQLEKFRQTGTAREKTRAQSAMQAYGRTLDLVRKLNDLREKEMQAK